MKDVEIELAAMLSTRADRIEPSGGHRGSTLRRARRRRARTAVGAVVLSVATVAGGFGAVGALDDNAPSIRAAAPDEPTETSGVYAFTSAPGEYPFVATGRFRDAEWWLRVAGVSPGHASEARMTFEMQTRLRRMAVTPATLVPGVESIVVDYEDATPLFDGDVAIVFGALTPETATVDVWMNHISRPDRYYDAHLFEGYDAKVGLSADYFLAFVPANSGTGLVIAKDADGDEVGVATIPQR